MGWDIIVLYLAMIALIVGNIIYVLLSEHIDLGGE